MPAQFEQAELLKKQYTDKFVVVKAGVAELRRFSGLTGVVKTVNMSGRALVLFDNVEDIGWYDIDPAFLTVVDAPQPKKTAEKSAKESPVAKSAPPAQPAPAAGEKKASPLDMIRAQGAGGAKPAAAPAAGGKLSPLDMIRQQQAAKSGGSAAAVAPAGSDGKKLSPIEMIRQQQAAKEAGASEASVSAPVASAAASVAEPVPAADVPKPAAPVASDGKKLSPLEQIRLQGAFKGK